MGDDSKRSNKDFKKRWCFEVRELFLVCALALPLANVPPGDAGGHDNTDTKETFIREYNWLKDFLKEKHPHDEFLIIPNEYDKRPPGWVRLPIEWRGHIIYRKPMRQSA